MANTELSGDEKVVLREIYGIPNGDALAFTSFTHILPTLAKIWEPTYTIGNFAQAWAVVETRLEALSSFEINRVRVHLTEWDDIGPTTVTRITKSQNGDEGLITDANQERENIREAVGNIIGLVVPQGGFYAEMKRRLAYTTGSRMNGDR